MLKLKDYIIVNGITLSKRKLYKRIRSEGFNPKKLIDIKPIKETDLPYLRKIEKKINYKTDLVADISGKGLISYTIYVGNISDFTLKRK